MGTSSTDRTLDLDGDYAEGPADAGSDQVAPTVATFHRHPIPDSDKKIGLLYRLAGRPDRLYRLGYSGPVAVVDADDESDVLMRAVPAADCPACRASVPHTSAFHGRATGGADVEGAGDGELTYSGDDEYSQLPRPAAQREGAAARRRR